MKELPTGLCYARKQTETHDGRHIRYIHDDVMSEVKIMRKLNHPVSRCCEGARCLQHRHVAGWRRKSSHRPGRSRKRALREAQDQAFVFLFRKPRRCSRPCTFHDDSTSRCQASRYPDQEQLASCCRTLGVHATSLGMMQLRKVSSHKQHYYIELREASRATLKFDPRTSSPWAASLPKYLPYAARDHCQSFESIEKSSMKVMDSTPFDPISRGCLDVLNG